MKNKHIKPYVLGPDDNDNDEDVSGKYVYMYNDTEIMNDVDAYIDGPIEHVSKYRHLLQYMRKMKDYDKLTIWLSTPGGYAETALQFIETMNNSSGQILVNVVGAASSAGSIIALSAPMLTVSDQAYMMCHAGSYGYSGKQGEVHSMVEFSNRQLTNALTKAYTDFLTPDELRDLLIGKEFWFDSEEINKRLESRQKIWQERMDAAGTTESLTKVARKKK